MKKMLEMGRFFLCLSVLCFPAIFAEAQDLDDLRNELNSLRKMLKEKESREQNLLEDVQDLEREINLRTRLLGRLSRERRANETRISNSRIELKNAEEEFKRRKQLVVKQLVSMYKRGRKTDLEILLSIGDMNQYMVWLRYQRRIFDHQNRSLNQLMETQRNIVLLTDELEKTRVRQSRIIAETESQQQETESKKNVQKRLLAQVRQDKTEIQKNLKEKERAFETIKNRIIREEKRIKSAEEMEKLDGALFSRRKGSLSWPVSGKIVKPFGRWQHPMSKTWHNNLGIDIQTEPNATIKSVAIGKVIWIDWVRGLGSVVILDHGGYSTVYGQLATVDVAPGDFVKEGQTIGQVGDRESLYGSTLHLQVWQGQENMNPTQWLAKQ